MRSKIGKIVLTLSLMLCMTTALFSFTVKAEENASATQIDDCSKVFKAYTAERASAYLEDDKYPTKDGYLFAGWYTTNELPENDEEAVEYAVEDSIPEGTQIVYALFVPDDVLTVQAQASVHLIDDAVTTADENGALRFVTTVDSLLYKKVGFELSYVKDGVEKTATSASNKVYKALYQADSTTSWSVTPAETFCGVSEYFKACTVKSIEADNYGTEFTVKAFWVTMSGDKVYGDTAVKVLQDGCVRKTVYVSSTPDISADQPYYGTEANPYASLNYAIEHVQDGGTVRVKDSLTVAETSTNAVKLQEHGKTITITGGTLTFPSSTHEDSTNKELYIGDNITFKTIDVLFPEYVFANGHTVVVASDVNVLNTVTEEANNLPYIYGGGKTNTVSGTCLKLYAGSYSIIYGGSHNANVTGNTNVVIGPGVNGTADPSSHEKTYLLYGGCRIGNVGGNTNVIVQKAEEGETPAKFNYVYGGGGYAASTSTTATVIGQTNVEFAGQAYSLYGGGRYGTNADTRLVMTGGEVYQIFGGCEYNSMTGNADVQVLGGKVYRRIYGGCYNNYSTDLSNWGWSDTLYQVTGYTSVTIGAAAEASLDTDDDTGLLAVSRYDSTFSNEWGTLIFNDDMYSNAIYGLSSEIGSSFFTGNQAYHYLVTANVGGDVYSAGNFIYIKPDSGNVATVTIDGVVKHYTECNSYYQLPALTSSTAQEEIVVTFGTTEATDFIANAAAKISTGSEAYAYYETLAQAIAAADKSENATITELSSTAELASITVKDRENGIVTSNYKNCVAGTTVMFTVTPDDGYYCSALSVTKDGEADALNEELTIDGTTYTFDTEAGAYTVEATFAKKVFDEPTSSTNTSWDLIKQNESTETLANGGTKITGTVVTTDLQTSDKMDAIAFVDTFTEMDFTFVAKDDPSTTAGNSTPGTQVVMDFGDGCSYQIRVVKNSGNIVLRAVGGLEKSVNRYTFTTEQADKFNSADGVEVRIVRYGTEIMFYVDGAYATTVDLSEFDNSIVTDDTEMTVSIKRFGDTGTAIAIPFTVVNKVTPIVQINSTTDGTVTKDKQELYSVGDTVTLTISPASGYYCNSLVVKEDGVAIDLDKALNMTDTTYSFVVKDATYTVDATFAEKVFKIATSNGYTSWNLMSQNESTETLTNGGTKITGTVVTTDLQTSDKMDAIAFVDTFTEMDFTFVAKDDPSTTAGNSTPGTQVVMDFGDGCSYQIRVVKNSGNIVLRAVGGLEKSVNRYTFTTEQADKFNSADGVEVRIVRYGTEIMFYVDGAYATTVDLSEFDNSIVTDDTEMTVSIKRFGDTGTAIAIPFTVVNKVSPVAVEVYDDASELVANDTVAADVQNIDLTSNETYSVTLTPQGFDSTAYFKITYVDHLTNETQSVYTPAVAAGESFEFTYQNGVFDSETEAEIATIRWENRIKATKDVLTVEVISGTPEGDTITSGAILGNAPMAKPLATTVETTWTIGTNVGSYKHAVAEGFTPGQHYAHTDVITVAKAGTELTFTDDVKTNSWASDGCYVVSSWKLDEDGEWVLDKDGTNIPGKYAASKTITCTDGYDTFVERYGTEDDDGSITYTYITSKDNENIMFCYYAGKGTTEFPTITSIYSGETGTAEEIALAADTTEWLESDQTRAYYDVFEGKTISVIGDSYMAGSSIADTADVWVNMFATKYNMTMNNHGVNGSTISNYAGSTYNPMVDRWEEDFANDTPDIIIVEGGRNDYNYNTPMGVLGNSDKATFKGATTYLISSLREKYPNAIIIGITCWEVGGEKNDAGYYCSDYGRAFIEVCEDLDVSYINAMDSDAMGIYMTSSNYRGRFCIKAGDISHLNEKGMKLVFPVFERKIYEFYDEYLNQ